MKSILPIVLLFAGCAAPPVSMSHARWELMNTGSTASLRGLAVVDADTVWASGSGGTVLRTVDGGRTWAKFTVPGEGRELRDVHALDGETAYVLAVTDPAGVLRTTDGGATWEEVYRCPHATAFLDSFTFFDERTACVFGDPIDGVFLVVRTEDGGATWHEVAAEDLPPAHEGEAAFAASGTCITSVGERHAWIATGGRASRVLCSVDAGRTWTAFPTPLPAGEGAGGIYSIAFRDEEHGVIVGGDYTMPERAERNAAFSDDGGRTWQLSSTLPRGHRAAVAFVPGRADTLVTVGRAGTDFSTDGGRTWQHLATGHSAAADADRWNGRRWTAAPRRPSIEGFYALAFAPDGAGWAAGAEGRIARLVLDRR